MYENMFLIIIVVNVILLDLNKRMNKLGIQLIFFSNSRTNICAFFLLIRLQLHEYKEYLEQKQVEQQRQANITKLEEEAKRTHHLVSTKAVPGIYNSKYLE